MVTERLKQYLDSRGITIAAFERSVGLSNAAFRKALSANSAIGSDKLENILSQYQDLSAEWLLRGGGTMMISDSGIHQTIGNGSNNNTQVAGDSDVAVLQERIRGLEKILEEKERIIQILLNSKG